LVLAWSVGTELGKERRGSGRQGQNPTPELARGGRRRQGDEDEVWVWGCRPLLLAGTVQAASKSPVSNCGYIYPTWHGSHWPGYSYM
jgi:hypothetical protein